MFCEGYVNGRQATTTYRLDRDFSLVDLAAIIVAGILYYVMVILLWQDSGGPS